jgi:hypothetical protein
LAALVVVAIGASVVGASVDGPDGMRSAAVGVALVAANHAFAVASTAWARVLGPRVVAVGYAAFVVRMLLLLGTFGTLQGLPWVNRTVLATSFCAALVASLTVECLSYARGWYVPSWRTTR